MKVIISSLLFLISFTASSQTWCDAGANWKYSYTSGSGAVGYTEISYVGDTLFNGQQANILDKHQYAYNYWNSQNFDFDLGREYTYEANGVVYLLFENSWDTLYNFNASIGESWRMAKQPIVNACDSNSTLTVLDEGIITINSLNLNYKVVEFNYGSWGWTFTDTLIEKIGFKNNYMLPYEQCHAALDAQEAGSFRCYTDDNFATYKPNYTGECDFIVSHEELDPLFGFQLVPNPAHSEIQMIGIDGNHFVRIHDLHGKEWLFEQNGNILNIDDLPSGVYLLSVQHSQGIHHQRFIKGSE